MKKQNKEKVLHCPCCGTAFQYSKKIEQNIELDKAIMYYGLRLVNKIKKLTNKN